MVVYNCMLMQAFCCSGKCSTANKYFVSTSIVFLVHAVQAKALAEAGMQHLAVAALQAHMQQRGVQEMKVITFVAVSMASAGALCSSYMHR